MRWIDRLLNFEFRRDQLLMSIMGLVDHISQELQKDVTEFSTYDEQFIASKSDAIKCGAKLFLLKAK